MGRPVEVSLKLEGRDGGAGVILVLPLVVSHLSVLAGSVGRAEELVAARLHVFVYAQGVLQIVPSAGEVGVLDYAAEGLG